MLSQVLAGSLLAFRPALVQINLQVLGGSAGSHDVQFPIAIEIGQRQVLARQRVVINQRLPPVFALGVDWSKKFDADLDTRFVHRSPADDDLIRSNSQ